MAKKKKKDEAAEEEESGGNKKGLLVKVGIAAVAGFVIYTQVLAGGGGEADAATTTTLAEPVEGAVIDAGEVRVTLADDDARFALVKMAVVLEETAVVEEVENRLPLLLDAAVDEIAVFNAEQLKGARGPERLRNALTDRAEEIFNTEGEQVVVMRVVLTELIVQ